MLYYLSTKQGKFQTIRIRSVLYYLAPCKHLPTHNAITPHITGLVVLLGLEVLGRVAHEGDVYLLILGDIVVVFRYFLRRYEC